MEINIQNVSMTYPSGKQALQNLSLELRSPSLIGLLGPKRRGQVHSDEAAGGRPAPHIRLHSGGRTAPSQDGAGS